MFSPYTRCACCSLNPFPLFTIPFDLLFFPLTGKCVVHLCPLFPSPSVFLLIFSFCVYVHDICWTCVCKMPNVLCSPISFVFFFPIPVVKNGWVDGRMVGYVSVYCFDLIHCSDFLSSPPLLFLFLCLVTYRNGIRIRFAAL